MTDPTPEDTELSGDHTEIFPVVVEMTPQGKKTFFATVPFNSFNGYTVSEVGLITKDGDLFARQVLPSEQQHLKSIEIQVQIYWDILV